MKNFISPGNALELVAPSGGVVSGQGYIIGSMFVVAESSEAVGDLFAGLIEGVVELPKKAATAMSVGDKISWDKDLGIGQVVPDGDVAEDLKIGFVVKPALAADANVIVKLTPNV